jgi:hypothetical protein
MRLARLGLALALLLQPASPALARMAAIETRAPLADPSDESTEAAVKEAIASSVHGALAMGFRWVRLRQAAVREDAVSIQVLAADTAPEDAPEPDAVALDAPAT